MITSNNRISHQDLILAGILFFNREEENRFLELANDKFASSVGAEVVKRFRKTIPANHRVCMDDVLAFIQANQEECAAIVSTVREQVLQSIKECRRAALP